MFILESPIYTISAGALLLLGIFGLYKLALILKHKTFLDRKDLCVLRVDPKAIGTNLDVFIRAIKPPFVLEVAVEHLSKGKSYYIIVPRGRAQRMLTVKGLSETNDYHLFHSGGNHLGAYAKDGEAWPQTTLDKISFSKVNEVGEGAAIQFLFSKRKKGKTVVNLRLVASAPSDKQAKEIIDSLKGSFREYSFVDESTPEFVHMVNAREFDGEEKMLWSSA